MAYGLDPVGNRLSLTSTLAGIAAQTNVFDGNDRLVADTYDANGNTTTSGGNTFGYEFEDRLTNYNAGAITYVGDGNRVVRTEAGSTTRFLIDTLTPTGYAQVAEEVVAGFVVRQYTHGLMRVSQRQNIAGPWTTSYYGYDGFGSTRQLLDGAGVVTDTFAYDGFGNLVARTGTTPNQYLYRGEALDAGTGMYYLRARWYRPGGGRFLTIDKYERDLLSSGPQRLAKQVSKIGALKLVQQFFEAYRFDSMCSSLYCYSYGDPIGFIDPSGLSAERAVTAQLSASSLGLGQNVIVRGSIQVIGSEATAFVELIEGTLGNPFSVLPNLMKLAISLGAAEIYVVTQFANPRLLEVATKRYGFVSYGGYEILRLIF